MKTLLLLSLSFSLMLSFNVQAMRGPGGFKTFEFSYDAEVFKDKEESDKYQKLLEKYEDHQKVKEYFAQNMTPPKFIPPPVEARNEGGHAEKFKEHYRKVMIEVKEILISIEKAQTVNENKKDVDCVDCAPKLSVDAKGAIPRETFVVMGQTEKVAQKVLTQAEKDSLRAEIKKELKAELKEDMKRGPGTPSVNQLLGSGTMNVTGRSHNKMGPGQPNKQQMNVKSAIDQTQYAQMIRTLQAMMGQSSSGNIQGGSQNRGMGMNQMGMNQMGMNQMGMNQMGQNFGFYRGQQSNQFGGFSGYPSNTNMNLMQGQYMNYPTQQMQMIPQQQSSNFSYYQF